MAGLWIGSDPEAFFSALRASRAAARGEQVVYEVLSPEQAADIDAIGAQIIPSDDDLPGAREARAVVFIDRALDGFMAGQKDALLDGLDELNVTVAERWPGAGRFAALTDAQQLELLTEIEDGAFFGTVRYGIITGMFAHPDWGGNHEGAGWKLLGFEPRFAWQPPFGAYDAEEMGR
jgi:gluconate 2-dehydrogenase gamma chain